ncbi:MAG: DUF2911 domain-containing protein [Bacteroidia bacterium]
MKKTIKTIGLAVICSALTLTSGFAQSLKVPAPSPTQKLTQDFALSEIGIEYSRPGVKGRVVFGDLVPFGKIWRTGANASTKITFGEDVKVEGKAVKAGTYAIYTIPNKEAWEIMLYSDLKMGGNVSKYTTDNEVLRIKVNTKALTDMVETFTMNVADITASSANIEFSWEKTKVAFNVTADVDSVIMANINETINTDNRPYYQAANYYYNNDKDLKKALEWVNKASEQNPKAFWVMLLKARIEYKSKDYKAATMSAEKVITMAKAAENTDYQKMAEELIADAKKAK